MKNNKQSLYTKYRPGNFDEVIGQRVAKDILINSITKNKINHAYLFFGIRGTGKTTLARIFAKAINCEHTEDHNPCNACDMCESITLGSAFDVIEIDAASNNGVDEIRSIRENTSYLTTSAKYKVYIIDEVHMLSKAAFNALLKTLEEPPQNAIFLLATTELQRIPQTVLSRTVVVNLEVMSDEDIKEGLQVVVEGEDINYEKEALDYITMVAGGSLRDGISALETVLLFNEELSVENTIEALGLIRRDRLEDMLLNDPMELVNEIDVSDKDPVKLALLIMEVSINFLKEGKVEYANFLNKVITMSNTVKDPQLLKIAIKTALYMLINHDDSRQEPTIVSHETLREVKSDVSRETLQETPLKEDTVENPEIEPVKSIEQTNEQLQVKEEIIENTNETQQTQEPLPQQEEVKEQVINNSEANIEVKSNVENTMFENDPNVLKVITDYVDVKNYMYIIKNNDTMELAKANARWRFIDNYITTVDYKEVVATLVKTQPLAATEKTLIVGFRNEHQINEFKRISLKPMLYKFIREVLGEYKFILPVSETIWAQLLAAKETTELTPAHTDIILDIYDYIENPVKIKKEKVEDLFGKDNVDHG